MNNANAVEEMIRKEADRDVSDRNGYVACGVVQFARELVALMDAEETEETDTPKPALSCGTSAIDAPRCPRCDRNLELAVDMDAWIQEVAAYEPTNNPPAASLFRKCYTFREQTRAAVALHRNPDKTAPAPPDDKPRGTPWKKVRSNTTDVVRCSIVRYWIVVDVNGRLMADTCSERAADLIVSDVNSRAELVERLDIATYHLNICMAMEQDATRKEQIGIVIDNLDKALSNAKGGER